MKNLVEVKKEDLKVGKEYFDTDLPFLVNKLKFYGYDENWVPLFTSDSDGFLKDEEGLIIYLLPVYEEVEDE